MAASLPPGRLLMNCVALQWRRKAVYSWNYPIDQEARRHLKGSGRLWQVSVKARSWKPKPRGKPLFIQWK